MDGPMSWTRMALAFHWRFGPGKGRDFTYVLESPRVGGGPEKRSKSAIVHQHSRTVAHQASLSMGFSCKEILEWVAITGKVFHPGIEPRPPALEDALPSEPPGFEEAHVDR